MNEIRSIADIQALILAGETNWKQYGEVNAAVWGVFILFNYTQMAQFAGRWNWFECHSRGLIFNHTTAEVVARPFPKFFNYGERMPDETTEIVSITEKMDGSLGILYCDSGFYKIATRGSFTSDQAQWATEYLTHFNLQPLADRFTLLFEIIYPENRIVVDYGGRHDLVLLAIIDRFTGYELEKWAVDAFARIVGFPRPQSYTFESLSDILDAAQALSANQEGWVIYYSDGSRFKIKGDAYRIAHKIMTGATFKRVLEAVESGQFDAMIEGVPDEFLSQVRAWRMEIDETVVRIRDECRHALEVVPQGTQKEFALWIQDNYSKEMQAYLFAAKSGKPIEQLIYRKAFENRANVDTPMVSEEAG